MSSSIEEIGEEEEDLLLQHDEVGDKDLGHEHWTIVCGALIGEEGGETSLTCKYVSPPAPKDDDKSRKAAITTATTKSGAATKTAVAASTTTTTQPSPLTTPAAPSSSVSVPATTTPAQRYKSRLGPLSCREYGAAIERMNALIGGGGSDEQSPSNAATTKKKGDVVVSSTASAAVVPPTVPSTEFEIVSGNGNWYRVVSDKTSTEICWVHAVMNYSTTAKKRVPHDGPKIGILRKATYARFCGASPTATDNPSSQIAVAKRKKRSTRKRKTTGGEDCDEPPKTVLPVTGCRLRILFSKHTLSQPRPNVSFVLEERGTDHPKIDTLELPSSSADNNNTNSVASASSTVVTKGTPAPPMKKPNSPFLNEKHNGDFVWCSVARKSPMTNRSAVYLNVGLTLNVNIVPIQPCLQLKTVMLHRVLSSPNCKNIALPKPGTWVLVSLFHKDSYKHPIAFEMIAEQNGHPGKSDVTKPSALLVKALLSAAGRGGGAGGCSGDHDLSTDASLAMVTPRSSSSHNKEGGSPTREESPTSSAKGRKTDAEPKLPASVVVNDLSLDNDGGGQAAASLSSSSSPPSVDTPVGAVDDNDSITTTTHDEAIAEPTIVVPHQEEAISASKEPQFREPRPITPLQIDEVKRELQEDQQFLSSSAVSKALISSAASSKMTSPQTTATMDVIAHVTSPRGSGGDKVVERAKVLRRMAGSLGATKLTVEKRDTLWNVVLQRKYDRLAKRLEWLSDEYTDSMYYECEMSECAISEGAFSLELKYKRLWISHEVMTSFTFPAKVAAAYDAAREGRESMVEVIWGECVKLFKEYEVERATVTSIIEAEAARIEGMPVPVMDEPLSSSSPSFLAAPSSGKKTGNREDINNNDHTNTIAPSHHFDNATISTFLKKTGILERKVCDMMVMGHDFNLFEDLMVSNLITSAPMKLCLDMSAVSRFFDASCVKVIQQASKQLEFEGGATVTPSSSQEGTTTKGGEVVECAVALATDNYEKLVTSLQSLLDEYKEKGIALYEFSCDEMRRKNLSAVTPQGFVVSSSVVSSSGGGSTVNSPIPPTNTVVSVNQPPPPTPPANHPALAPRTAELLELCSTVISQSRLSVCRNVLDKFIIQHKSERLIVSLESMLNDYKQKVATAYEFSRQVTAMKAVDTPRPEGTMSKAASYVNYKRLWVSLESTLDEYKEKTNTAYDVACEGMERTIDAQLREFKKLFKEIDEERFNAQLMLEAELERHHPEKKNSPIEKGRNCTDARPFDVEAIFAVHKKSEALLQNISKVMQVTIPYKRYDTIIANHLSTLKMYKEEVTTLYDISCSAVWKYEDYERLVTSLQSTLDEYKEKVTALYEFSCDEIRRKKMMSLEVAAAKKEKGPTSPPQPAGSSTPISAVATCNSATTSPRGNTEVTAHTQRVWSNPTAMASSRTYAAAASSTELVYREMFIAEISSREAVSSCCCLMCDHVMQYDYEGLSSYLEMILGEYKQKVATAYEFSRQVTTMKAVDSQRSEDAMSKAALYVKYKRLWLSLESTLDEYKEKTVTAYDAVCEGMTSIVESAWDYYEKLFEDSESDRWFITFLLEAEAIRIQAKATGMSKRAKRKMLAELSLIYGMEGVGPPPLFDTVLLKDFFERAAVLVNNCDVLLETVTGPYCLYEAHIATLRSTLEDYKEYALSVYEDSCDELLQGKKKKKGRLVEADHPPSSSFPTPSPQEEEAVVLKEEAIPLPNEDAPLLTTAPTTATADTSTTHQSPPVNLYNFFDQY